jgi:hypothetical protein
MNAVHARDTSHDQKYKPVMPINYNKKYVCAYREEAKGNNGVVSKD